ncbi:hypothetical protein LZL87_014158 [Fusarium oxysporum]|nr:hypothetical protein LZL87_014158 [Fusarium oxysporum]
MQPLLRIKKEEGKIMTCVMDYVIRWVNTQPADIIGLHENNKPLRRDDLKPAIKHLMTTAYRDDWWAQLGKDDDIDGIDDVASWLDLRSRTLERQVLDYIRSHITEFRDPSIKHYLNLMPKEYNKCYAERFSTGDLWTGLFHIIQRAASDRCRKAVENNESDDGEPWSIKALQTIQVAYQGYEKILAGMALATAIPEHDDDYQQQ